MEEWTKSYTITYFTPKVLHRTERKMCNTPIPHALFRQCVQGVTLALNIVELRLLASSGLCAVCVDTHTILCVSIFLMGFN